MCLLKEYHISREGNIITMSAVSSGGCKCISSDPLGKHFDVIRKAEYDADISIKSKWNRTNRVIHSNQNKRNNYRSKFDGNKTKNDGDKKTCNSSLAPAPLEAPVPTPCAYRSGWKKNKRKNNNKKNHKHQHNGDVVDACPARLVADTMGADISSNSSDSNESSDSKKVHFDEEHLVQLIEFPDDEESENMRKCYWEVFAVDRCRFKDRISQVESCINSILSPDHRQRIYNQRFVAQSVE